MKTAIWNACLRILCFAILLAALPSASFGQWEADSYTSYANDDTYIYTTVVVEGEVTAYQGLFLHTYSAYNPIGGVGGWTDSGDPTSDWVTLENDQQIDASDGSEYEFDSEAQVNCNYAGLIYDETPEPPFLKIVHDSFRFVTMLGNGTCVITPTCTGTCTAAYGSLGVGFKQPDGACYPYEFCSFLAVRSGSGGGYSCPTYICYGKYADPQTCT